mmetsp:Transcript_16963/g.28168  ORF Transcript_16963/g.28168 Transcript_16963/m.28168 type:complete len:485 (+) Transcript_16963:209-1663(+)
MSRVRRHARPDIGLEPLIQQRPQPPPALVAPSHRLVVETFDDEEQSSIASSNIGAVRTAEQTYDVDAEEGDLELTPSVHEKKHIIMNCRSPSFNPHQKPDAKESTPAQTDVSSTTTGEEEAVGALSNRSMAVEERKQYIIHVGFHSWVLMRSTRSSTSTMAAAAGCVASFILIVFQSIVLVAVITESAFPGCEFDESCRPGQYCTPAKVCQDCSHDPGASTMCSGTDTDHCDYIVEYHQGVSLSTILVLVFAFIYIVQQIVKDMDQSSWESDAAMQRLGDMMGGDAPRRWLALYVWFLYYYREYMLPASTIIAAVALMITVRLTSQNIILNGLAITVVSRFDEELIALLVFFNAQNQTSKELSIEAYQIYSELDGQKKERNNWIRHRIYCVVLATFALFVTIETDWMVGMVGRRDFASCDNITDALLVQVIAVLVFSATDKVIKKAHWKIIIRDLFCGPLVVLIFLFSAITMGELLASLSLNLE